MQYILIVEIQNVQKISITIRKITMFKIRYIKYIFHNLLLCFFE